MNVWMKLLRIIPKAMYAHNHTMSSIGKEDPITRGGIGKL